jgi:hypothetical protein
LQSSTAATLSLAVGTSAKTTASATVAQMKRRRRHGDRVATPQRESSPTPRPTPTTSTTQSCPKPVQHNHSHVKKRPGPRGTSRRKPHGKPQASACTQPPAVHKLCVSLQFRQAEQRSGERGWRIGSHDGKRVENCCARSYEDGDQGGEEALHTPLTYVIKAAAVAAILAAYLTRRSKPTAQR